ncbi:MAG: IPT/TIG domain-containing protein [Candidatus Poseidoniaceae archaeon]|nr:IPT/TIG domain-containing protein [Candidatus Poseidoniaceae archaeon]
MRAWLVVAALLSVMASPVFLQPPVLEESGDDVRHSSPIQATISPSSGWTSGDQEITITGTGFADLAFSNITNDGINHQWVESTVDYTDQTGEWNSIAVDSNGHIHIVHINGGNYQIRHSVYDGSNWNSVKINDCGHTYCWDVDLVIDGNDELHVAYTTYTTWAETLVYMHYDGTSWSDTQVSPSANFGPIGIAVDSNNHPHISHAVSGQYCGDGLRLASYDGSSWSYNPVDIGDNRGCESDIVIDENDNIYIAYQNRDESKLKIATDKSGSWDIYTVDTGTSPSNLYPGYMTSMAMDRQGQFHIAHFDDKNDDLRYSTGAPNSQWTTTIVEASGHTGRETSIAVDIADNPHIVYHSWNGFVLKYATIDPATSNWTVRTISNADVGDGDSLFIDQNGVMHVSFYDGDNEVMNYATKSTGLTQTQEIRVQFGQYGSMTGTVVNDTTITVTTPLSGLTPDTIDITLWDKDGNSQILSSSFEFISQEDLDNDGVLNDDDDCPNDAGTSTEDLTGCPDDDGDGYSNSGDAFPSDGAEWADSDGDSVGDNADEFPSNPFEQVDSDGDGVGDNSDAFPNDASETTDSDGDGVGDNSDVFPMNAFESIDSDGDGYGDNSDHFPNDPSESADSDGDGVGDNSDAFPDDATQTMDTDGDGVGDLNDLCSSTLDNQTVDANGCSQVQLDADGDGYEDAVDDFPLDATQWLDSDGDGYGDNWADTSWNASRMSEWTGVFIANATQPDYCPDMLGNSTADAYFGCLDQDGNGIADVFEQDDSNETNETNETTLPVDSDNDGVSDVEDNCPGTAQGAIVDENGCVQVESSEEETNTALESFFSGEGGVVTTTVGVGAILLALFTLLQTNAVAAMLPDTFRWVQVLRKNSKLTKEERNELTYLQSLVQAYHANPEELAEELVDLKGDITARFTNNQIKKETREKLFILIGELQSSTPSELYQIAHNEAYFGLSEVIDTGDRSKLLDEKLAMTTSDGNHEMSITPSIHSQGELDDKGTYWIEWPGNSGTWYYRYAPEHEWTKFEG